MLKVIDYFVSIAYGMATEGFYRFAIVKYQMLSTDEFSSKSDRSKQYLLFLGYSRRNYRFVDDKN